MKKIFLAAILIILLASSGICASEAKKPENVPSKESNHLFSKIVLYIPNRILDVFDIFKLNLGVGPGIGAHIQVTEPLQTGILMYDVVRIGLTGKRFDFWRHEYSSEFGLCYAYYFRGDVVRNNSEIGGILQLLIIGAEASINLEEFGDFISGIFLCDAKEDDLYFK